MVGRIVMYSLLLFAVFYLLTDPDGAARLVTGTVGVLHDAGESLSRFVSSL